MREGVPFSWHKKDVNADKHECTCCSCSYIWKNFGIKYGLHLVNLFGKKSDFLDAIISLVEKYGAYSL